MPAKCPPKHFQINSQCQFTVSCGVVFEAILTLVTLEMKAQFETKSVLVVHYHSKVWGQKDF